MCHCNDLSDHEGAEKEIFESAVITGYFMKGACVGMNIKKAMKLLSSAAVLYGISEFAFQLGNGHCLGTLLGCDASAEEIAKLLEKDSRLRAKFIVSVAKTRCARIQKKES